MTVLTGETGAGKSIIIDALGLLAGGRGSVDFIRKGAAKAVLQGQFVLPASAPVFQILDDLGIDHEDQTLILQRDLYQAGRNVCRINGVLVNLTSLRKVGEMLIDIHGQNEHQSLMRPETHLSLLDEYDHHLRDERLKNEKPMKKNGLNGWIFCNFNLMKLKVPNSFRMKKKSWLKKRISLIITKQFMMHLKTAIRH